MLVLITGGARSGKSGFAERYAACLGSRGYYVATSRIWDEEMGERVALHRQSRQSSGFRWETVEEPLKLAETLERLGGNGGKQSLKGAEDGQAVILVDCLTLWLSNLVLESGASEWTREERRLAEQAAWEQVERLPEVLGRIAAPVLLVTNEVGSGIVPEYPLGRLYRDLAGRMNQRLAAASDQVFAVTAGIPVELKQLAFQLPKPYGSSGGRE